MKHAKGPTKKLAPMIAPEVVCPHTFSDDEGVQLEVSCTECAGAHDLQNSKCLAGIVNLMSAGAEPETIILKRFTHKRYRGEDVRLVAVAAAELAALNRALVSAEPPSDKKCRTCSASIEQIVGTLKRMLLGNPAEYLSSRDRIIENQELVISTISCASARACLAKGLSTSTLHWRR